MLDSWVFRIALLLLSLLFLFHGCVLLFYPNRYIPSRGWGRGSLRLVRKPPLQIGKRFGGLCLSAAIIWFVTLPAISWILHPKPDGISSGESPLPRITVRWDLLGVAIFAIACGYLLFMRTQKSVESFCGRYGQAERQDDFPALDNLLTGNSAFSRRLVLLPFSDFIRSLH